MSAMRSSLIASVVVALGWAPVAAQAGSAVAEPNEAWRESVPELGVAARTPQKHGSPASVRLERITTAVPWPRGLSFVDGRLVVLARGRHRRAGGCDPDVQDHAGSLFQVDPSISEPVVRGAPVGAAVKANARILVAAQNDPFHLWDYRTDPASDVRMDRPYCTLVYDDVSRNLFICGYSGVDLPEARFRKNATDSIHRFDLRTKSWHPVEMHAVQSVPRAELTRVVPNQYYPHHDPASNAAPHGWLNGPDGAAVVGDWLYAVGKDNHALARYDLSKIRLRSNAPVPESEQVLGRIVPLRIDGTVRPTALMGPSALAVHGRFLYLGYRTSSVVVRMPIAKDGSLVRPVVAELVAEFQPYDPSSRKSANLIDLRFNSSGELFASCASRGRIWRIGKPDPKRVFDGNDARPRNPTRNLPYVDLRALTGNPRSRVGNIIFDDQDRLYLCSGNYDSGTRLAGVIYRAVP